MEAVSPEIAIRRLSAVVEGASSGRTDLRVLDAGCGSDSSRAGFPVPQAFEAGHVTGIDVAQDVLDRNSLLDERIVGNLETVELPIESFHVVVCWDVLEHLSEPMRAVDSLARAVTPGGILVVGIPNLLSLKGLITKATPFWFHRLVYERVFAADSAPFRTYLRRSLVPARLQEHVERRGFDSELAVVYGTDDPEALFGSRRALGRVWRLALQTLRLLSLGRMRPEASEAAMVFRRRLPLEG